VGTLTYDQIKTEVLAALGNRADFSTDRLTVIANLAQMRIARAKRWEELDAVTTGTLDYTATPADDKYLTMPTGTRDIYTFRLVLGNGESRKLSRKTVTFFDRIIPDPAYVSVNKPQMYTLFNDKAELWPVPDAAYDYEIRRCAWPLAFTGEGDLTQKSDLDEKDDMITALSISWAMQSIGRSDDAARWWIIYTNMLNSAIGEDVEKPDQVIAPDFELGAQAPREYWKDPWVDGR